MRRLLVSLLSLAFLSGLASAQTTTTQTFGSGANSFSIDFVQIGNLGNVSDTTGSPNPVGSVGYTYNIGKYEVNRDAITKANAAASLGITLYDMTSYGGNGLLKPATGISWYEAAKFVNYLNTSSGSTAAYKFDASGNFQLWTSTEAGYNANNLFRNSNAIYYLPSTAEWYKAAYGSLNGAWYSYPSGSDTLPAPVPGGTSQDTAVFSQPWANGPSNIDNAGGLSAYGTMGQGGNVREWTETAYDGINNTTDELRETRGGMWAAGTAGSNNGLDSSLRTMTSPSGEYDESTGFRIAMVPEPSSLSLLVLGGVVMLGIKKRYYLGSPKGSK
jgi:hypothetical protein